MPAVSRSLMSVLQEARQTVAAQQNGITTLQSDMANLKHARTWRTTSRVLPSAGKMRPGDVSCTLQIMKAIHGMLVPLVQVAPTRCGSSHETPLCPCPAVSRGRHIYFRRMECFIAKRGIGHHRKISASCLQPGSAMVVVFYSLWASVPTVNICC